MRLLGPILIFFTPIIGIIGNIFAKNIIIYKQVAPPESSILGRKIAQESMRRSGEISSENANSFRPIKNAPTQQLSNLSAFQAEEKAQQMDEDSDSLLDAKLGYRIINVKHELAMRNTEIGKTAKDFYINMGLKEGLSTGTVLKVFRDLPIFNEKGFYRYQELSLEIAQLKVIEVQEKVAIARLQKLNSKEERPILDYPHVLVGDRVEKLR